MNHEAHDETTRTDALEERIAEWRSYLLRRNALHRGDVDELDDHLRNQVKALTEAGLAPDEAFLVAVKRIGEIDELTREFAREHSERLWKQVVGSADSEGPFSKPARREAFVVLALAALAATAAKIPEPFGISIGNDADAHFYARNFALFVLPCVAGYFAWKRGLDTTRCIAIGGGFAVAAAVMNILPFAPGGSTEVLAVMHLPIVLWLAVGIAYTGGRWASRRERMNFIRFTGELFIYYVLIALGGVVLTLTTMLVFTAIGYDAEWFVQEWLLPCGVLGALVVASWLVEAKQSVIENMAPVLTQVFTPLFTGVLLVFLATMAWTGTGIQVEREVLIGFDLVLVVVLGLLLYAISARDPNAEPGPFDYLRLLLVTAALLVDLFALGAIAARISEFGFSANKAAALGLNLILLANLSWSAWLQFGFVRGRAPLSALESWQTGWLPVYSAWAGVVVVLFPPIFGYL